MNENITIQGVDRRVPQEAEEEINDAIHDVLNDHGMEADVVFWEDPDE